MTYTATQTPDGTAIAMRAAGNGTAASTIRLGDPSSSA